MHTASPGHIVALGGGGFSMESQPSLLDDYILSLSPRQPARICFIPTASADSAGYIVKFYRAFVGRALPTDLTLFDPGFPCRQPANSADLREFVMAQDILYVGGGNTVNLLAIWRAHGLDVILRDAWLAGKILCGISAGMLCWFRGGITDSFGEMAGFEDGLGLIDATASPHYDGEAERRPLYQRCVREGLPGGYAADDFAALHFQGAELVGAISSRPGAKAYRVECIADQVIETELPTRYLGG